MNPSVEALVPGPDPVRCCEQLAGLPYRVFLDSSATSARFGRYSFLMADPVAVVHSRDGRTRVLDLLAGRETTVDDPMAACRELVAPHVVQADAGMPPFQCGLAGYVAYDWGLTLERLPAPRYDDLGLPDLVMGFYDWVLAWDHVSSTAWLVSSGAPETSESARRRRAAERAAQVRQWIAGAGHARAGTTSVPEPGARSQAPAYDVTPLWWTPSLALRSSFTRQAYLDAVQRVRDYIFAGDIFQANLSQRFEAPLPGSAWTFYKNLRARNAAPFAAFIDFPDVVVASASPERFLRVGADGAVETRPIKGTRPRGLGPEHDAALGQALAESAKDRAENLMIVDLMRNDLSRVCAPHSVRVSELFSLERYATVHHLVSTVVGQLGPGRDAIDLLRAAFPGGSITGAPKLRAMEVIAELEPSRRGVYCGTIGYWSLTGALDTSIAIRTAVARGGRVYFSAGGGIVADSVPEDEYVETLDKAKAMIDVLAADR